VTWFADFTSGQNNVSYTRMRQLLATSGGGLQEGIIGAGDLKVSQRGAGANMSVDVAVGDAWVQYDTGTRNGLSHVWSDAIANVAFNASDATNPRIDQIGVQLNDTSVGAGTGGNIPTLRYVPGTATAGATLDNRTGAVTTGLNDWMRLADILVPAASTSVTTANIRDRRPWARGASRFVFRTSGDTASFSATSWADIDATNLKPRIECSGVPLRISLKGMGTSATAGTHAFAYAIDGDLTGTTISPRNRFLTTALSTNYPVELSWGIPAPTPGSHLISPVERAITGAWNFLSGGANGGQIEFSVEEIIRPNADNT
jgi:hypothetical protein